MHSAWAGYWSFILLRFALRTSTWTWLQAEPDMIALPVVACVWLPFAVGLWFERGWAWMGSFCLSTLSLFVTVYFALFGVQVAMHEGWQHRSWLEFVSVAPAILVTAALLYTRRHFFARTSATS